MAVGPWRDLEPTTPTQDQADRHFLKNMFGEILPFSVLEPHYRIVTTESVVTTELSLPHCHYRVCCHYRIVTTESVVTTALSLVTTALSLPIVYTFSLKYYLWNPLPLLSPMVRRHV